MPGTIWIHTITFLAEFSFISLDTNADPILTNTMARTIRHLAFFVSYMTFLPLPARLTLALPILILSPTRTEYGAYTLCTILTIKAGSTHTLTVHTLAVSVTHTAILAPAAAV
jgi:hypothetical protein